MQHEKIAHYYQHSEKRRTQYHMRHMQKLLYRNHMGQSGSTDICLLGQVSASVMCLYTLQLMLVLILPTPNGWPGLVNLGGITTDCRVRKN